MDFRRTSACVLIAILCVLAGFVSSQPYKCADSADRKPQTKATNGLTSDSTNESTDKANRSSYNPPQRDAAIKRPEWWLVAVAFLTLGAVAVQAWYTRRAVEAATESNEINRTNLISVQRAFVFMKNINPQRIILDGVVQWWFFLQWENSGTTPTKDLRLRVNYVYRTNPLPVGHNFPDFGDLQDIPVIIGPNSTATSPPQKITADILARVRDGTTHLYFYGWAEYWDVFKETPKHTTKFCHKVSIVGDPTLPEGTVGFQFAVHPEYNEST